MSEPIIIGSRGSDLALWQANHLQEELRKAGQESSIKIIKTQGDRIQHLSFDKMEGKGFFTKEIENALLTEEIDVAVHSHKDLETTMPEGLDIVAVSYREDPSDVLLVRDEVVDQSQDWLVPHNGIVGTSSARRKGMIRHFRPDVQLKDLRGNVPTRIGKLRDGGYDAIILAMAGIARIDVDLTGLSVVALDPTSFIAAPAQGVLAYQIRSNDAHLAEVMKALHHSDVFERIYVERSILKGMEGGCHLPFGAYCEANGDQLDLYAGVTGDKGAHFVHRSFNKEASEEVIKETVSTLLPYI